MSWPVVVQWTVEVEKSAFANWIQLRNLTTEWHMEAEYLIDSGDTFIFYLTWMYYLCLLFHFPQNENSPHAFLYICRVYNFSNLNVHSLILSIFSYSLPTL